MSLAFFKYLRIVVSLFFLVLTSFIFIDFANTFANSFINGLTYLQFVPSLLKFLNLLTIASLGFLIILILNFFVGRVYCSTVCPLGIMQDVISSLSKLFRKKKKIYRFTRPHNILRYSILSVVIITVLAGSVFALNLLDPFSGFGKIFSGLFKPVYVEINNFIAGILNPRGIYSVYPVNLRGVNYLTLVYPVLLLGLVGYLSFSKGRLYCNTVCPVGAFLGILSKFSLYKIKIDEKSCDRCGSCSVVCKAGCIDVKNKAVDFTRCVGCFNCLKACPASGINYYRNNYVLASQPVAEADVSKRDFLGKSLVYLAAFAGISKLNFSKLNASQDSSTQTTIPEEKNFPVSPPGSISISHFTGSCTACHLCVSACPTHVLKPSYLEYGLTGMMLPHMDYHASFCNFDCNICTQICPTGAILPLTEEQKRVTQIGKVYFEIENCVVYTDDTACGSCSEHCPTQAVKMVPYKDGLTIPEVHRKICIGCGACEYACPTRPYRAIYVDGNNIHKEAKKPKIEDLDYEQDDDFPF